MLRRVCIIAGDISPIDVITPLPVLCEDNDIPYVYVPSKEVRLSSSCTACDLGAYARVQGSYMP